MESFHDTGTPRPAVPLEADTVPQEVQENVCILALREQVVFPSIQSSIRLRQQTFELLCKHCEDHHTNHIGVITLKPTSSFDFYEIGTLCKVVRQSHSSNSRSDCTIVVEGRSRFQIVNFHHVEPYHKANIKLIDQEKEGDNDANVLETLAFSVRCALVKHLKENRLGDQNHNAVSFSALLAGKQWQKSVSFLADMIGAGLGQLVTAERQQVLATIPVRQRLLLVLDLLCQAGEAQRIQLANKINSDIQARLKKQDREKLLKRQLQELRKELSKIKNKRTPKSSL